MQIYTDTIHCLLAGTEKLHSLNIFPCRFPKVSPFHFIHADFGSKMIEYMHSTVHFGLCENIFRLTF